MGHVFTDEERRRGAAKLAERRGLEWRRRIGRQGGQALLSKRGREFMKSIAALGVEARWHGKVTPEKKRKARAGRAVTEWDRYLYGDFAEDFT